MPILLALRACLARAGVPYQELHHEPALTSAASARARGEDLCIGGKALVLKVGERVALFVLSATRKLDSAAIKSHFGVKKLRFVSAAELHELTGLVPGAVPPFGAPILPLALYVDPSILANRRIAFNAGSLTDSIIMAVDDYIRVAQPTVFRFALAEPEGDEGIKCTQGAA
jgi:prolyl-tRNA editing enzyme YbaK/EbsC (Cys-tRNA(Pro) deacylase)